MDGYKIGELSNAFGLSNDAIRYYESRGILTPTRSEESGYRYYDSWDINFLLDCLRYRSYGFTVSEIEQMLHTDDLQSFEQRCRKRENKLIKSIEEQRKLLKQMSRMRRSITDVKSRLGEFSIEDSPEMIWQCQRSRITDEEGELVSGQGAETVRLWMKHMEFLSHTFVMPPKTEQTFNEYSWGFSLTPEQLSALHMEIPDSAVYIPSYRSVHSVFVADDEGSFMKCVHEQVINPVKAMGHRITNPPLGNLIVRVHENGQMKRYMDVWVPIE